MINSLSLLLVKISPQGRDDKIGLSWVSSWFVISTRLAKATAEWAE